MILVMTVSMVVCLLKRCMSNPKLKYDVFEELIVAPYGLRVFLNKKTQEGYQLVSFTCVYGNCFYFVFSKPFNS